MSQKLLISWFNSTKLGEDADKKTNLAYAQPDLERRGFQLGLQNYTDIFFFFFYISSSSSTMQETKVIRITFSSTGDHYAAATTDI